MAIVDDFCLFLRHNYAIMLFPKLLFPALLLLGTLNRLQAQAEETIFSDAEVVGGFGAPFATLARGDGEFGAGAGGGGGVIVNDFFFGGFGQGETYGRRTFQDVRYTLALGYGGLWAGYVYPSYKVAHLFSSVKVGWGGVTLTDFSQDFNAYDSDAVFVVNPEIGLEVNILHWFRIAATGGYRFVGGIEEGRLPGIEKDAFNSPTFALTFRFGGFGFGGGDDDDW
jgi:hypothetical protein